MKAGCCVTLKRDDMMALRLNSLVSYSANRKLILCNVSINVGNEIFNQAGVAHESGRKRQLKRTPWLIRRKWPEEAGVASAAI